MKIKYLIVSGVGVVATVSGELVNNGWVSGFGLYFLVWGLFGDILNGVQWHKNSTINTQNVDFYVEKGVKLDINQKEKPNVPTMES